MKPSNVRGYVTRDKSGLVIFLALVVALLVAECGGGGGSTPSALPVPGLFVGNINFEAEYFNTPFGAATDGLGNVYVVNNSSNSSVLKISPAGVVTTLAGGGAGGSADGTGAAASFMFPRGVATDGVGNVYVADTGNSTIRKITPAGEVTTLAGTAGAGGSADGTGMAARFNGPEGVATDGLGNVYVADTGNSTIRKITPAGLVTTLAGMAGVSDNIDGIGAAARFNAPAGIATDGLGNVYVAQGYDSTIRKITPAGVVTTLAGTAGASGSADGTGAAARFNAPAGVATDGLGNVYVADSGNSTLRQITPAGVVTTLAGAAGVHGSIDGNGAAARFQRPYGIATYGIGNMYTTDIGISPCSSTLRKIIPGGIVTTLVGPPGVTGSADGTGAAARFYEPHGIATDISGNVYVADTCNATIRKILPSGVVNTLAGSAGMYGSTDGAGATAHFNYPDSAATDAYGNVYVADTYNYTIRKITPSGVVTTLAGTAGASGSADGTGAAARFMYPHGIATDGAGNVYVADTNNFTIRQITPSGVVTTLAGTAGASGSDDGTGTAARFGWPVGVATDGLGNVYVADAVNYTIRKITRDGAVSTLAGTAGTSGGANGTGAAARFNYPHDVATDASGNVYVADGTDNTSIRKITPAGVVSTVTVINRRVSSGLTVKGNTLYITMYNGVGVLEIQP